MLRTRPPASDFALYPDPNNWKRIKAAPKSKDGRVGQQQTVTFGNYSDHPVRVTFPVPLGGPDCLDIPSGAQKPATIIPDCEGDFVCPVFVLIDQCPTCGMATLVAVERDGSPLAADRTDGGSSPKVRLYRPDGDGEGDEDPIIKIKP